ncbi:MAG: hypothetical protein KIT14_21665 [bacterium]|nr:hypothetical protein [bacterium]
MPFHALLADGSSATITVAIETTPGVRVTAATPALDAVASRAVAAAARALEARRLVPSVLGCRLAVDAAGEPDALGLPLLLAYAAHALGHAHGRALPIGVAAAGGVGGDAADAPITAVDALDGRAQAGTLALTPGGTVVLPAAGAAALSPDVRQELDDRSLALVRVATVDDAVATVARLLLGTETGATPAPRGVGAWLRSRFGR